MYVTLKTLQQQTFKVEVDPEETVKVLKEKIEKEKGADTFPAAGQKLIYAGKILDDEKPVSFYKIEEKNFVVVMVTKPKPAAPASAAPPASAASSSPAPATTAAESTPASSTPPQEPTSPMQTETPKPEEKSETPSNTSSSTDATVSESNLTAASESTTSASSEFSTASAESALVTGQMYEDAIAQIVNMGFELEQVQRAMRASFNNPDRAVEYLFSGIPDMPAEEPPASQGAPTGRGQPASTGGAPTTTPPATGAPAPAAGAPAPAGGAPAPAGGTPAPASGTTPGPTGQLTGPPPGAQLSGEETLAFLRNQPQFQHMRNLLQTNPALLPELLRQIGRSNPALLQMISQNQEQFIAMLNEEASSGGGGGGSGGSGGGGAVPPGAGVIHVTPEEKEAIDRLKALGFPEGLCIQAYFACEKNEELAANYLLSHGFDDDDS